MQGSGVCQDIGDAGPAWSWRSRTLQCLGDASLLDTTEHLDTIEFAFGS